MKPLPRLSGKETLILELLCNTTEMYGLEMVKVSRGRLKRGTIYVTLNRMEEKGYIDSYEGEDGKRLYKVTGHGSRVLAAWQAAGAVFAGVSI